MTTSITQSIVRRFRWLIGFALVSVALIVIGAIFPYKLTFSVDEIKSSATTAFNQVVNEDMPQGFQFDDDPSLRVELANDRIVLYAAYNGSFLGSHETNIEFVTNGYPVYAGNGSGVLGRTFVALYELISGNRTEKSIVFNFGRPNIVDETFTINGEPAVEFVVPAGQDLVGKATETTLGQAVTGLLERAGRDVSEEARDNWTADTMRKYQSLLISWFEGIVQNQINGHTLYQAGDSPTEQFLAASFGGFAIDPGAVALKFYATAIIGAIVAFLFGFFFSLGYFVKQFFFVSKDQGVIDLDEETIEKIGNVTDAVKDIPKL